MQTSIRIIFAGSACLLSLFLLSGLSFDFWHPFSKQQNVEAVRKHDKANIAPQDISFHAHPLDLSSCVTFRVRGQGSATATVNSSSYIYQVYQQRNKLRIGLEFVDRPDGFISYGGPFHDFHFFHFLEFLVVAMYHVLPPRSTTQIQALPEISWLYVPLFTREEICGATGLNCKVLEMLSSLQERPPSIYGLDANDPEMLPTAHPGYSGQIHFRSATVTPDLVKQAASYEQMLKEVDAIILVDRKKCGEEQQVDLNKIWTNYIENFPSHLWHQLIRRALSNQTAWPTDPNKLVACYIDRQNTGRSLPDFYHQWIIQYLQQHKHIQFFHAFMEKMSSLDQIRLASACEVMVGGHGNGLSHMLWMKPGSYVIELFWNFPYQYDYNTAAQLMQHKYLGLWDLDVLPFDSSVSKLRDEWQNHGHPAPLLEPFRGHQSNVSPESLERGKLAFQSLLQKAITEKGLTEAKMDSVQSAETIFPLQ